MLSVRCLSVCAVLVRVPSAPRKGHSTPPPLLGPCLFCQTSDFNFDLKTNFCMMLHFMYIFGCIIVVNNFGAIAKGHYFLAEFVCESVCLIYSRDCNN